MMGSLYIGATGLKSHGQGMGVIGNNLANVNTIGYKQISMQYADLMSEFMTTSAGNTTNFSQTGKGVIPGETRTLHTQGGAEPGKSATDLSINGSGFFGVTQNGQTHYTRAGNFWFNNQGELLDASGWNVLGRPIVGGVEGDTAQPIKLNLSGAHGRMAHRATSTIASASNLGGLEDKSSSTDNPFFSMASKWNGAQSVPLGTGEYSYSEPISFYDSSGNLRTGKIYFDGAGSQNGLSAVEYVVALDKGLDGSGLEKTQAEGLLMAGTLTFSSDGSLANMTAFVPPASGDPADLSGWTPAAMNNGQPVMTVQTKGSNPQAIALDLGISFKQGDASGGLASAAEAAANPASVFTNSNDKVLGKYASTAYGETPGNTYQDFDGWAEGSLLDLHVAEDGIVYGVYSNGQTDDLYRVSLYRFVSQDGLRNEGGNHYSATQESGAAEEGVPGDENFGSLAEYSLEQSNVDYAREFSLLITTQRGFQMNSKVVTTSDAMLQKALEIKRS